MFKRSISSSQLEMISELVKCRLITVELVDVSKAVRAMEIGAVSIFVHLALRVSELVVEAVGSGESVVELLKFVRSGAVVVELVAGLRASKWV